MQDDDRDQRSVDNYRSKNKDVKVKYNLHELRCPLPNFAFLYTKELQVQLLQLSLKNQGFYLYCKCIALL